MRREISRSLSLPKKNTHKFEFRCVFTRYPTRVYRSRRWRHIFVVTFFFFFFRYWSLTYVCACVKPNSCRMSFMASLLLFLQLFPVHMAPLLLRFSLRRKENVKLYFSVIFLSQKRSPRGSTEKKRKKKDGRSIFFSKAPHSYLMF